MCLLFLSAPAWAQDAAADPTLLEKLDQAFGAWFVGPLATVMFFDLLFFLRGLLLLLSFLTAPVLFGVIFKNGACQ